MNKEVTLSIRNTMCTLKIVNNITHISEADVNRILYPKTKITTRGKKLDRDKIADFYSTSLQFGISTFYPMVIDSDDCYHNRKVLSRLRDIMLEEIPV